MNPTYARYRPPTVANADVNTTHVKPIASKILIFPIPFSCRVWASKSSTTARDYIQFDGRLHRSVSRNNLSYELFVPRLKNEQRPDLLMSGKPTVFLQIDNFLNSLWIEILSARGIGAQQCVADKITQLESKPGFCRNRKAFLGSIQDRRW